MSKNLVKAADELLHSLANISRGSQRGLAKSELTSQADKATFVL